jgi:hypothetical protein
MKLSSSAFDSGKEIPLKYSCDGADISPPLEFDEVPDNAKTLALILEDPDAPMGTFDHWIIFNIPAAAPKLAEGIPVEAEHSSGYRQGTNDFGNIGYGGPCPPDGEHRYFFRLYALDGELDLPAGSTSKADLQSAMEGRILAETELMGTYKR